MENFVIRIYRRPKRPTGPVVGVVEDIGRGRRVSFHGMEELCAILTGSRGPRSTKNRSAGRPHPSEWAVKPKNKKERAS